VADLKDRILERLARAGREMKGDLAFELEVSRADVEAALNELEDAGRVVRSGLFWKLPRGAYKEV
jgi:DNA-binding MarR family transcriptional regulator